MIRKALLFALSAVALFAAPSMAAQESSGVSQLHSTAISAAVTSPQQHQVPLTPNTSIITTLMAFSLVGATSQVSSDRKKGRMLKLKRSYLFDGVTYGPTEPHEADGTWVPSDFPELTDDGDVIHPEGTAARARQERQRSFASPPSTGGVDTGEGRQAPNPTLADELDELTVSDLRDLATKNNLTVTRQDDEGNEEEGDPIKRDYVRALSAAGIGAKG